MNIIPYTISARKDSLYKSMATAGQEAKQMKDNADESLRVLVRYLQTARNAAAESFLTISARKDSL